MNGNTSASNCPSLKVYGFFCETKFLTLLTAEIMNAALNFKKLKLLIFYKTLHCLPMLYS